MSPSRLGQQLEAVTLERDRLRAVLAQLPKTLRAYAAEPNLHPFTASGFRQAADTAEVALAEADAAPPDRPEPLHPDCICSRRILGGGARWYEHPPGCPTRLRLEPDH